MSDSDPFADALADAVIYAIALAHAESVADDPTHAYADCPTCHALARTDRHPTADTDY